MREAERGFTLVEMVVAVAIAVMLAAAGGVWMMSLRGGALRAATSDFDSALAAARQVAATSGNGATIAFTPRTDNGIGYVMRAYAGRPNGANAVKATNLPIAVASATVSEATLGTPPFAVFLSSAGYPTGKASYPIVDAHGVASFPVVSRQPPCPSGGIVLTFRSVQGATMTRRLACNVAVSGTPGPNPSPTPNVPHITPLAMVAHWTNDRGGALKFEVGEFGYTQPYTGDDGCSAITTWAQNPLSPSDMSNRDEPIAHFELYPIAGTPGACSVSVSDVYTQAVSASVQVMGDLTWENRTAPPLQMTVGDTATLTFGKTYDNEALHLQYGGNCAGAIAIASAGSAVASSIGTTPTTAAITITATAPTPSCTLEIGDQYGEPTISIPIGIHGKLHTLGTIHFSGAAVGQQTAPASGGGSTAPGTTSCSYAQLYLEDGSIDANAGESSNITDPANHTDAHGCVLAGYPVYIWAKEQGYNGSFEIQANTCVGRVLFAPTSLVFTSTASAQIASINSSFKSCIFPVTSSDATTVNGHSSSVSVLQDSGIDAKLRTTTGPCTFHPTNLTYSCAIEEEFYVYPSCGAKAHGDYVGDGALGDSTTSSVVPIANPPTTMADWVAFLVKEQQLLENDVSGLGSGSAVQTRGNYVATGCIL